MVTFEDDHLLVVNKPAGWNPHAPDPFAPEGLYEWLRHREPRWAGLATLHRLDKVTSGLVVFGKTSVANRALTGQFTRREVRKEYRLRTRAVVEFTRRDVRSGLHRAGEQYVATPADPGTEAAETRFEVVSRQPDFTELRAFPRTGRTHQIRVHAAANGFPILGDTLYGGAPAIRVCLHAEHLAFRHPVSGADTHFHAPVDFTIDPAQTLRAAVVDPAQTDAWRLLHAPEELAGARENAGSPSSFHVDRLGNYLLAQGERPVDDRQLEYLRNEVARQGLAGAYFRTQERRVRGCGADTVSPRLLLGDAAPAVGVVRENGVGFEIRFAEGCSVGLFLDQRDNRRRLLVNHVAAGFPLFPDGAAGAAVLNTFAYTCAFSVCAARAGAHTTSLDLSRKYLDWGRQNFALNDLDPARHDFIFGDTFDWLRRLARKGRAFDLVLLDPPTFSTSKAGGVFRAGTDYGRLVTAALPVLRRGGVLFASTNAANLAPATFLAQVHAAITAAGRRVRQEHYVPQPPDFPVSRIEPAYLKTVWLRVD